MTKIMMATPTVAFAVLAVCGATLWSAPACSQSLTPEQRASAAEAAQSGVPISELASTAPDSYTVRRGDTLWAIAGIFLKQPWRWPALWGMNQSEIKNPHRIYPGQKLYLERKNGHAMLRGQAAGRDDAIPTVRVSPRTRYEGLSDEALPTLKNHLIEPFLVEPMIVDEVGLQRAARIVATQDNRVLLTRGDRAYARGQGDAALFNEPDAGSKIYRVFRDATALKDPVTGLVLGYEAQYVGRAVLVHGESTEEVTGNDGKRRLDIIPATIDITAAKEEMRVGDRLLPEPERELLSYVPHAPAEPLEARVVSVYGNAVANAAQNQVVVINRGSEDGVERGHVLAILKDGARLIDKTDDQRTLLKLPNERNGLMMVFRTFDKLSYALVLEITQGVKVGDRLVNPR